MQEGSVFRDGALLHVGPSRNRPFRGGVPSGVIHSVRTGFRPPTRASVSRSVLRLLCTTSLLIGGSSQASGQGSSGGWNAASVLELLNRARDLRQSVSVDPDFTSYRADGQGYVYFFVDRPDSVEQVLMKVDQVALDVYWRAPNSTRQHIAGLRDEEVLPTSIRYHLDHLTVVQDDFGDFIRLGDGDEVEAVLHPVGPDAADVYDYQLVDSLSLSYAAGTQEVRVYEVRVRPKDFGAAGFVGTLYLDRDRAAIVRMNFSFTPASYVDPYLDYIRISMDNSLWMGTYWLPYQQEIEIRRETPLLDFMAGSVIRSRFDIRGYEFNTTLSDALFAGRTVTSASVAERERFPFERGLFDDLEEQGGLAPSPTMAQVRSQIREVVDDQVMSGLAPVRFHLGAMSDIARYNRAEGLFLGGGSTFRLKGDVVARALAGYSIGRRRASGGVTLTGEADGVVPVLDAYWDDMGDIGGHPGTTRLENTISSASGSRDFLDPFFRRGARITFGSPDGGRFSASLRWEEHLSARDVVSDGPETEFRPVRSIHEGSLAAIDLSTHLGLPYGGHAGITTTGGRLGDRNFASLLVSTEWTIDPDSDAWSAFVSAAGGITNTEAPAQTLYLLGGRHTLPGHGYRSFVGNAYWLVRAEATLPVWPPYLGIRGFLAAGATHLGGVDLPADWIARDSYGVKGSAGLGLSIGWDAMRFDVGRAVWGTGWEVVFSAAPRFRAWL